MMGVQWTEEQKKVIELRNRNILVSAAAGSGKTAVLVERIIRMLTDSANPMDVDRLLIVTFTEAAAAEMKERIRAAVEKALEGHPGDVHLQRQATLIHSAHITTIHSFCLSVIREHFHVIDLDPGFRIAEEGELKLLKQDVLSEVLESCYEEGDEQFLELVEKLGAGRNDHRLEELVLELYEYSRSYPQPKQWLAECAERYHVQSGGGVFAQTGADDTEHSGVDDILQDEAENVEKTANDTVWMQAEKVAAQYLHDAMYILRRAAEICDEPDGPYLYLPMLESDLQMLVKAAGASGLQQMYQCVTEFQWQTLSRKKDQNISSEKREEVKNLREQAKKLVKELQEFCFFEEPGQMRRDMRATYGTMGAFATLVQRFADAFLEKKQSRGMIDFGDMEQFALQILTEEQDGKLVPSPAAREYQKQFQEVMIDEYQDSNLIQEAILTSVSGVSNGNYNIFMVGDVKQSIYRFRLSRPELFMEKYDTYSVEDGEKVRIDLHRNFRSREEVLDSVNLVFSRIMRKELGGIVYDEQAALYPGAAYKPLIGPDGISENQTELLLLDTSQAEMNLTLSGRQMEARMVARRIKELMANGKVWDKDANAFRRVRYQDIVILTRSARGWADVFVQELTDAGIPVYAGSKEGYFETYEVSVLLNYLQLLENRRQDVPLASVLTSPLVGLDAQQMAQIRMAYPEGTFFEAVQRYAGQAGAESETQIGAESETQSGRQAASDDDEMNTRRILRQFYEKLSHFRRMIPYMPIHELIWRILEETGYSLYVAAMPGGAQRLANVEMLVEKAAAFEETSYKGLFHFVRYIEHLKKYDVDYGEANIADEQSDTVRIMTIHKSKGLEFPIVFVCGLGKQFNMQDVKSRMVIHPEWGVGLDNIDLNQRTKVPTLLKKLIQREIKLENLGEELRVLYVAMTRAKEKLILTGEQKDAEETIQGMLNAQQSQQVMKNEEKTDEVSGAFPFYVLSSAKCYMDWILPAVAKNAPVSIRIFTPAHLLAEDCAETCADIWTRDILEHWDTGQLYDEPLRAHLQKQFAFVYPYETEGRRKLKFTVSELKKRVYLAEESGELLIQEPEVIPLLPQFLREEEELTGASRGSAYHKLLELLDFSAEYEEWTLKEAIDRLVREGRLSREMADCIRVQDILGFLKCESGKRMHRAACAGTLFKEQPFVLNVPASEVYPEESSHIYPQRKEKTAESDGMFSADGGRDMILVQGIIDAYFEEKDGLILLDYKTDKVRKASDLREKYHAQLDYYAKALEQLLDKPVKEKWIYSFTLKEEIRV